MSSIREIVCRKGYHGKNIMPWVVLLLCIFALGGTSNVNLKNFARSYFCMYLLLLLISVVLIAIFGIGIFSFNAFSTR